MGLLRGLPSEDQKAIKEVVGKAVTLTSAISGSLRLTCGDYDLAPSGDSAAASEDAR